jgi:hypothetical protein
LLCAPAGEDVHASIARRYGVPMMSVRDTLHDLIWDDAGEQGAAGAAALKFDLNSSLREDFCVVPYE